MIFSRRQGSTASDRRDSVESHCTSVRCDFLCRQKRGQAVMKVLSSYQDGRLTLHLAGELDHHEAAAALRKISQTMDDYMPRDCVVDLDGLTFMDSSGIALILKISRLMAETGGRAWVANAKNQPLKVIDASGIDRVIQVSTGA